MKDIKSTPYSSNHWSFRRTTDPQELLAFTLPPQCKSIDFDDQGGCRLYYEPIQRPLDSGAGRPYALSYRGGMKIGTGTGWLIRGSDTFQTGFRPVSDQYPTSVIVTWTAQIRL